MIIRNMILFIIIIGVCCVYFVVSAPATANKENIQYEAVAFFCSAVLVLMVWFITWIKWQPLYNMIKRREEPWRWSEVNRVKQDGAIFPSLEENPRELFFDPKEKKNKAQTGIPIIQRYHRNGYFGNAIHFLVQGKNETTNLLQDIIPSKDDKLANTTQMIVYNSGYADGVADTLKDEKGNQLQAILPYITIAGLIGVGYLVSQNTDLLKQIAGTLASMAAPVVAGA